MLIADLSIPFYYTVQVLGLPWISARRLATFALIAPFLIAIAASSEVRRHITERIRASLPIFICVAGFLVMAALSIFTSPISSKSMSALVEAILSWYVPFFAIVYMVNNKTDIILILKIICVCAIFNTAAGLVEFRLQRNLFVQMFPSGMLRNSLRTTLSSQASAWSLALQKWLISSIFGFRYSTFFRRI